MKPVLQIVNAVLFATVTLSAWSAAGTSLAQTRHYDPMPKVNSVPRSSSPRRQDPPPRPEDARRAKARRAAAADYHTTSSRQGVQQASYHARARSTRGRVHYDEPVLEGEEVFPYQEGYETEGFGGPYSHPRNGYGWHSADGYGGGCGTGGCSTGGCGYGGGCGDCGDCCFHYCWIDELQVFGGAHGFKGPVDLGNNGNFGLHEGVNWAMPIWTEMGIGGQVGGQIAHSNFSGDTTTDALRTKDRTQYFITAGLFRRVRDHRPNHLGFQWGVVADWFTDEYYVNYNLWQLRIETSLFGWKNQEIGYAGHVSSDSYLTDALIDGQLTPMTFTPTNQHRFFFRKHFCGGAEWRIWGGFTDSRDGLFGSDFRVPLSDRLVLDTAFNYLKPNQGPSAGGMVEEAWGLAINLVWYPGRSANRSTTSPWRPLFNVADNSSFMVDVNDGQ